MRTIYKYTINTARRQTDFHFPKDAEVIHVAMKDDATEINVNFWVEANFNEKRELHKFIIYGTGHEINDGDTYVGTAVGRTFVWHLYEVHDAG